VEDRKAETTFTPLFHHYFDEKLMKNGIKVVHLLDGRKATTNFIPFFHHYFDKKLVKNGIKVVCLFSTGFNMVKKW